MVQQITERNFSMEIFILEVCFILNDDHNSQSWDAACAYVRTVIGSRSELVQDTLVHMYYTSKISNLDFLNFVECWQSVYPCEFPPFFALVHSLVSRSFEGL